MFPALTRAEPEPDCLVLSLQKYRYHDDEPPVDPSPGHMTHSAELSHAHLDGFTAALTVGTTLPTMHLVPERPPGGSSSFMSSRLRHHYGPDRTRTTGPGQNPLIMFCSGSDQQNLQAGTAGFWWNIWIGSEPPMVLVLGFLNSRIWFWFWFPSELCCSILDPEEV